MLLAINERIKGWLGAFIVVLIGLPFALWGIESYLGGGKEQYAVLIDETEVSSSKLDRDVSQLRQQIAQDKTAELPEDEDLRRTALERIINTTILENQAEAQGYDISDPVLASNIRKLFSHEGEFMTEQYRQVLNSQGMSPSMFEQAYRSELRVTQLQDAIITSAIVTPADVRRLIELSEQERDINWLQLNVDKLVGEQDISDDDIQKYYEENSKQFMRPATVSVEYVELSMDTIKGIEVDEADIKARYDEYVEQQRQREERKASHILVTTDGDKGADAKQKIIDISIKLNDGKDFAELAKEYSEDSGSAEDGGDLDWISLGQMVKPFEDALFELEKGQVSDVVQTEFGYHIIKLEDVRSAAITPFEDMKDELAAQSRQAAVDSMLYDLSEIMANAAYENPDSLEPVADALELEIKTTELFGKTFGKGIAEREIVRNAAFSDAVLQRGENSDLVELAPDHVLVLRVKDHNEASPLPLDMVRNTIDASIRLNRGQEIVSEIADGLIEQLKQGADISSLAKDGIENKGNSKISVLSTGGFDANFISQVMSLPLPDADAKEYGKISLATGDVAVVVVNKVTFPQQISEQKLKLSLEQYRRARAIEDFASMLSAYKDKAEIHINEKVINRE